MGKGRLEAFSDVVIAIIITIMVLELRPPREATLHEVLKLWPVMLSYAMSFIYVGIYWNNHHHLWHAAHKVNGATLWANLHLLFWLSLVPFATDWMGASHFQAVPVGLYGFVLLMAAVAFTIMVRAMIALHGRDSVLAKAVGADRKGKISLLIYILGIGSTFFNPWIGFGLYTVVSLIWLVPDRRIENRINTTDTSAEHHHDTR